MTRWWTTPIKFYLKSNSRLCKFNNNLYSRFNFRSISSSRNYRQITRREICQGNWCDGNFSTRISNINALSLIFRALKDQGYQSDSTLVFKKRSDVEQLSPVEQKTAYKSVQLGGEVPLHGFRKPLPERPRGECDLWPRNLSLEKTTNIVQIASTMKTPTLRHPSRARKLSNIKPNFGGGKS